MDMGLDASQNFLGFKITSLEELNVVLDEQLKLRRPDQTVDEEMS